MIWHHLSCHMGHPSTGAQSVPLLAKSKNKDFMLVVKNKVITSAMTTYNILIYNYILWSCYWYYQCYQKSISAWHWVYLTDTSHSSSRHRVGLGLTTQSVIAL